MTILKFNPLTHSESENETKSIHLPSHPSFLSAYETLQKWQGRFPAFKDENIVKDLMFLYLMATKKYLDHRNASHLSRLTLSIHFMRRSLQRAFASSPHSRHLEIKWLPTRLIFPFSSKPVVGCLIGFNLTDRYELFDEENILLILRKSHPEVKIVPDSSYCHVLPEKNLKIIYFEIERTEGSLFTLAERNNLVVNLEKQIRGSFQKLTPTVFMRRNEEEVYKTILTLSREIHSVDDIPQAWISFERQHQNEVIFLAVLVYASPKNRPPLHEKLISTSDCTFVSKRLVTVRHLKQQPIEAHVFNVQFDRNHSLIRSDGSLDFYACRQKVASLIKAAVGEFRDYNGGSLIKQHELLDEFKMRFPEIAVDDSELMETFFYGLTPLEQQALIHSDILATLFQHFLDSYSNKLSADNLYWMDVRKNEKGAFLAVQGHNASWKQIILNVITKPEFEECDLIYTIVDIPEGLFFHAVIPQASEAEQLIQAIQNGLQQQLQTIKQRQILRIGMEYPLVSLDPRVGGDFLSRETLKLLFEGLTRIDKNGQVEKGVAETIEISSDQKQYIFRLRPTQWNDGSSVKATDFEYAWKKVLSPDFKTAYAYLFYPIRNAREGKEGKVSLDKVGISAIDDHTLKIDLAHPASYFLELTAQPIYFPVHQMIDQRQPQWPYQVGHSYPCNGPFELAANDPGHQTYRFLKNPIYWDSSSIALDEILLTQINAHQALTEFYKGQLDWIGNPFGGWYPSYKARPTDQEISVSDTSTCWLVFNTASPLLNHSKIRRALALAIDRAALVADTFSPLTPAYSLLPPMHNPQAFFPHQDIPLARQTLDEGLRELNISKESLPALRLIYHPTGTREMAALRIAQQLKDFLGLECDLQPTHWVTAVSKIIAGDFEMSLFSWNSQTHDPIITLNTFRHAQEGININNWEDPTFQHYLQLSDDEISPSKRASYLKKAEERLCEEMPTVPLFYQPYQALIKQGLEAAHRHSPDLAKSRFTSSTQDDE